MSEESCINFQFGTQSNDKHVDNECICEGENQFCIKKKKQKWILTFSLNAV